MPDVTVDSLVARFQVLSDRKRALESKAVELKTTYKHHKEEYDKSMEQLKEKFKVSSLKEAYQLRDQLQKEVDSQLTELDQALSELEQLLNPPKEEVT